MSKIPAAAKRVFKGVIFDVYQWDQEMFDGTTQTFEMLKRPNTVEVISVVGDKILLSLQSQPDKENFYSLFGGRCEPGEEPIESGKRELLEESGLESDDWELFKEEQLLQKIDWADYIYIARNCRKVAEQKLDNGERIEIKQVSFDEFVHIVLSDNFRNVIFTCQMLRMLLDKQKLEEFKKRLFKQL